jgi:nucleoside-diphosphate-sugar epimerase
MPLPPIPTADLDEVLAATAPLWPEMRNQRLFLTGGTGFFGCWLVESFLHIDRALDLNASLTVLSRNPEGFLAKLPHLRHEPALTLVQGDIRSFAFPAEPHSHILHAATESTAPEDPEQLHDTIVSGTRRVLNFAASTAARKLLLTSSGAVYGPHLTHIPEDFAGTPQTLYGHGKRTAERLCLAAAQSSTLEVKIARGFAFLGPHLPLDAHFAVGNFLGDALTGRNIHIASDGLAVRSYLYAADLTTWLWMMLFRGQSQRPYNVGSEESITIRHLAETIQHTVNPSISIEIARPPDTTHPPHRYVPSTIRARHDLGLRQSVSLEEALRRTAAWHQLK